MAFAKGLLNVSDFLSHAFIFDLNRSKVIEPGINLLRLDTEGVRLLHENLILHSEDGPPECVGIRLFNVVQRQGEVDSFEFTHVSQDHISLLAIHGGD